MAEKKTIADQIKEAYAAGVEFIDTSLGRMTIEEYCQIRLNPRITRLIYRRKEYRGRGRK